MDIYVQSCGTAPEHDYLWLKISQDDQSKATKDSPSFLKEQIDTKSGEKANITDLYESHDHSIVLAKDGTKLLLLVTAFKAIQRSKDYGRGVRNSVALLGEYEQDERVLRIIAAKALEDWESLRKTIDEAVSFDKELGFKVNINSIEEYIKKVRHEVDSRKFKDPDETRKIAKNSAKTQKDLADELQKCHLPPNWNGPIVIVTGNVSEDDLTQYSVWRSISERVKDENWKDILNLFEYGKKIFWRNYLLLGILFLVIASAAILIILKIPSPKPQLIQPTQTTPQSRPQASPAPQVTPQPKSQQNHLHQETLQPKTPTKVTPTSDASNKETTQPNPTGETQPRNRTETTASQKVELQSTTAIDETVDSERPQQPIGKTFPSELKPTKNPLNSSEESMRSEI